MLEEMSRQTSTEELVAHFKSVFKIPDVKKCRILYKSKDMNTKYHPGKYIYLVRHSF